MSKSLLKARGAPGILRLPTELFQYVAGMLDLHSNLSLLLSCRQAYLLLDSSILKLDKVGPEERLLILVFLHRFDRRWRLCHSCATLHRLEAPVMSRGLTYMRGPIWWTDNVLYRVFVPAIDKESGVPSLLFQLRRSDVVQVQLRALRRNGLLHGYGQCAHTLHARHVCEIVFPALDSMERTRVHVRKEIRGCLQRCCGNLWITATTRVRLCDTEIDSLERPSVFIEAYLRRILPSLNMSGCIHGDSPKMNERMIDQILDQRRRFGEIRPTLLQISVDNRCSCQSHLQVKMIDKLTFEVVHRQVFSENWFAQCTRAADRGKEPSACHSQSTRDVAWLLDLPPSL